MLCFLKSLLEASLHNAVSTLQSVSHKHSAHSGCFHIRWMTSWDTLLWNVMYSTPFSVKNVNLWTFFLCIKIISLHKLLIDHVISKMLFRRRVFLLFLCNHWKPRATPFLTSHADWDKNSASAGERQSNFGYTERAEQQTNRELTHRGFLNRSNFLDILALDSSSFSTFDRMMFTSLNADCDSSSRCSTASPSGESVAYYPLNQTQVYFLTIISI